MSRRIVVEQNVCGGDGGHQGLTIIENVHKVRKKIFVLLFGCYMHNYWEDRTDTGLCVPF